MLIKVLPDHVINQISAGEVIERPASVVRELVDNAVDAGATEIAVYIEAGGKALIRVNDNGCGMQKDEALMAFERHATSKLSKAEDLLKINTLGFRGEALPSIASVSKVFLKSKTKACKVAVEVCIEGGVIKSVKETTGNQGTEIQIKSLFYNTPARRNFLKTNKTEELRIKNWLRGFSLVHPDIRFKLYSDQKEILNFPRRDNAVERAAVIFKGSSLPISSSDNEFEIKGLVAHPSQCLAETSGFLVFINKRPVSDRMVIKAVKEGFDSMLKEREFPVGFLDIAMPSELVDVNVHPQKSEVRFRKAQDVYLAVRRAVFSAVSSFKNPLDANIQTPFPSGAFSSGRFSGSQELILNQTAGNLALETQPLYREEEILEQNKFFQAKDFRYSDLNYIGQIFSCYLLAAYENSFYIIDMHAAHERCNFNLIKERFKNSDRQTLLLPLTINLNEADLHTVLEFTGELSKYGFALEAFSQDSLLVREIPSIIKEQHVGELLKDLAVLDIQETVEAKIKYRIDQNIARLACHASIRSGYKPSREEVYALFTALDSAEFSHSCPHGRPVSLHFSRSEVEKWFGRDS